MRTASERVRSPAGQDFRSAAEQNRPLPLLNLLTGGLVPTQSADPNESVVEPSSPGATSSALEEAKKTWRQAVAAYQEPDLRRTLWQLINSIGGYLVLLVVAYRLLSVSYWLALPVQVLAAGFLIRVFIIFHDCGHGSLFRSKTANELVGYLTGILTFTPYHDWRIEHARHHATAGDLDRRGLGDIWTMTVSEYREAPWHLRLGYRLYRNPIVMLGVGPLFTLLIKQRLPHKVSGAAGRRSVHLTNLAMVAVFGGLFVTLGVATTLLVLLPVLAIAGAAGIWLFYVQHQFDGVYWERRDRRDYVAVALEGSSMYALPRVLQWFSGNIGFHHIHHLSPAIPNYRLPKCFREQPVFQQVPQLTLAGSLRSLRLRLYDEESRRLVGFSALRSA
jgi:omega-6 fatty acid desaturase (delta-12 desaturase)